MRNDNSQPKISTRNLVLAAPEDRASGGPAADVGGYLGSVEFSIPFPETEARGLEPDIEISYGSSSGNGLFGFGFGATVPSVRRATDQRTPQYRDDDVFVLDDTLVSTGTAPRTAGTEEYAVTTYLRRTEAQRPRIERWVRVRDGDTFWRSITPENEVSLYGSDAVNRIADPQDATRVAEWLIERRFDARGNVVAYEYRPEDAAGVVDDPSESGRLATAMRHLVRVRYGNRIPYDRSTWLQPLADLGWCFEQILDYGDYDFSPQSSDPYTPVGAWSKRADAFSSYRFGFECRTRRLCRNVALFHRFDELGTSPRLVSVLQLGYAESTALAQLNSVRVVGYQYQPLATSGDRYRTKASPALRLTYAPFDPAAFVRTEMTALDGSPLGDFAQGARWSFVDLEGRGIPGILRADGMSDTYWSPALSADGRLGYTSAGLAAAPLELKHEAHLSSLRANGRLDLVVLEGSRSGAYHFAPGGSGPFVPFMSTAPDLAGGRWETFDAEGTGRGDLVCIEGAVTTVVPAAGDRGYGERYQCAAAEDVPSTTVPDPRELVGFATLCGTGSPQRFRIRDGSVECWPSLGYGRFAPAVRLAGAPRFRAGVETPQIFLADLDGSGLSDVILAYTDGLEIYVNRSGSALAFAGFVPLDRARSGGDQIAVADLLGEGTESFVVADYAGGTVRRYRYDFAPAGRPYLITQIDNGSGARTSIRYQSAARYSLEDEAGGRPWIGKLPCAINLVTELVHEDLIAGTVTARSYRYHDGAYDADLREFRGFAFVEHYDVQRALAGAATMSLPGPGTIAIPALTKTWFHTGILAERDALAERMAADAFGGDLLARPAPPDTFVVPEVDGRSQGLAYAALSGAVARTEVFGLDDPSCPYAVTQHAYCVQELAGRGTGPYASFRVIDRETISSAYERVSDDPCVTHDLTLAVDPDAYPTLVATVYYPRRAVHRGDSDAYDEQFTARATFSTSAFIARAEDPDNVLAGLIAGHEDYELAALGPPDAGLFYTWEAVNGAVGDAGSATPAATLLAAQRWAYAMDAGRPAWPALLLQSASLAFDDAVISKLFGAAAPNGDLTAFLRDTGGYQADAVQRWWIPGPSQTYLDASHFYLPAAVADPFVGDVAHRSGLTTSYGYDGYDLLLVSLTRTPSVADIATLQTRATRIDYRVGAPVKIVDPNGVTSELQFDPLGQGVLRTLYGMENIDGQAQAAGFAPLDFDHDPVPPASLEDLLANVGTYLGQHASFAFTDELAWETRGEPQCATLVQGTVYPNEATAPPSLSVVYVDGTGRAIQTSTPAAPGPGLQYTVADGFVIGADGTATTGMLETRWQISGRAIYDDKGQLYRSYTPFFAQTPAFIPTQQLGWLGTSGRWSYDAVGRIAYVFVPHDGVTDAFFTRTTTGPWSTTVDDRNDTVRESRYYVAHIDDPALPRWERDALQKASAFAATPVRVIRDNLGEIIAETDLLADGTALAVVTSRRGCDIVGNELWCSDARLGPTQHLIDRVFGYGGLGLAATSADAGSQGALQDVAGNPILITSSRGFDYTFAYDSASRATSMSVTGGDDPTAPLANVVQRTIYGDSLDASGALPAIGAGLNALTRPVREYDQGGVETTAAYTLGGAPLASAQQLRADAAGEPNWALDASAGWQAIFAQFGGALDAEVFATSVRYDGGTRVRSTTDPAGNVRAYSYDVAGDLTGISLTPAGEATVALMTGAGYDPDGQLQWASIGTTGSAALYEERSVFDPWTRAPLSLTVSAAGALQPMHAETYWYDPAGNVTHIERNGLQAAAVVRSNAIVSPDLDYRYDSLYRLRSATGRAKPNLSAADQRAGGFSPFVSQARSLDDRNVEPYVFTYEYDLSNNLVSTAYRGTTSGTAWQTGITVASSSNRAVESGTQSGPRAGVPFDAAGNALTISTAGALRWDYANVLRSAVFVDRGTPTTSDLERYEYRASGERIRKTAQTVAGSTTSTTVTTYLPGVEITRIYVGGTVTSEWRRSVTALGGHSHFEHIVWISGTPPSGVTTPRRTFGISAQGSAVLEIDATGSLVSYEEYAPYGATTFVAAISLAQAAMKSRRFISSRRDDRTGLYYCSQRYYAPWIGRWINPDPIGMDDGTNIYAYCGGNPSTYSDPSGTVKRGKDKAGTRAAATHTAPAATSATAAAAAPSIQYNFRKRAAPKPITALSAKRGNPWSPQKFSKVITYMKDSVKNTIRVVSATWRAWLKLQKRPTIPYEVRAAIIAETGNSNAYLKYYKSLGVDTNLEEAGLNQDHKLAQSWIGVEIAGIMARWEKGLTAAQQTLVENHFIALHDDRAKGIADANTLRAVANGTPAEKQRAAKQVYISLAGKALGNYKIGSAQLNQLIFNSPDWNVDNKGDLTPRSFKIRSTAEKLAGLTGVRIPLDAAKFGSVPIDSRNPILASTIGSALAKRRIKFPQQQRLVKPLEAMGVKVDKVLRDFVNE